MRKIIMLILGLAAALSFSGCSGNAAPNAVHGPADLKGRNIGAVEGTTAKSYADTYGTLRTYQSAETMLVDLKSGVVDCAVMEQSAAKAIIGKVPGLKILGTPLVKADLCFAVAKESPDLTKAVNGALKKIADSGLLVKIVNGYKTPGGFRYTPASVDTSAAALTLAVNGDFPPYSYDDGSGQTIGIDVDVARAVCDILHVQMKITLVPRKDLVTGVQFGKASFALGGITNNKDDAKLVDFSDSYAKTTQVIIVRR